MTVFNAPQARKWHRHNLLIGTWTATLAIGSMLWCLGKISVITYRSNSITLHLRDARVYLYWGGEDVLRCFAAWADDPWPWPSNGPMLISGAIENAGWNSEFNTYWRYFDSRRFWSIDTFGFGWPRFRTDFICGSLILPLGWFPILLVSTVVTKAVLFRRRQRDGHCRTCGYDLTGNESGICPECGRGIGIGNS